MRHSVIRPVIWLSLFALGAAACGDDSDDDSSTSNPSTEEGGSGARSGSTGGRSGSGTSTAAGGRGGTSASSGRGGSGNAGGTTGSASGGRGGSSAAGRGGSTASASGGSGGAGSGGSAGQQAASLGDAEIVAVLTAANNGEIQQNNVAVTKAVAPAARSYAQDLVNMHTAAQTRLNGVISAENLTPKDSSTSSELTMASSQIVSKLQAADLSGFDMVYLQAQIDVHRQVLELIDGKLLPGVKSSAVRAELTATRAAVVDHLNRARAIALTLDLGVDGGAEADAGL